MFILLSLLSITVSLQAKQVTTCTSYLVGAKAELDCVGINGKVTMQDLYKKGWKYVGDISGTNKFVLVFEK
ncbi:hypothetical protein [Sulfurimonas sp.]|uniref:hypothetical protein n=1 Tax=Sulfurimonas sp. TaxID=2022749 RepID=UPI003D09FCD8